MDAFSPNIFTDCNEKGAIAERVRKTHILSIASTLASRAPRHDQYEISPGYFQ
jgi:hypothetical protein